MKFACAVIAILLVGCLSTNRSQLKKPGPDYVLMSLGYYDIPWEKLPQDIGPWTNYYAGNANLAGVIVNQYVEGPEPKAPYAHKHPAWIWYVFWNGDVESFVYSPEGLIEYKSLWKEYAKKGDRFWNDVDFSHGSDPKFKDHSDPRPSSQAQQGAAANP